MLARNYKFIFVNNTGVQLNFSTEPANDTLALDLRQYKVDGANALQYGNLVQQSYTAQDVPNTAWRELPAIANDVDLMLGLHALLKVKTTKAAAGTIDLYLDVSTDGGTTWASSAASFVPADLGSPILALLLGNAETRHRWFEII